MASFKEVQGIVPLSEKNKKNEPSAASKILASHSTKDKRVYARVNDTTFEQFSTITSKLGTNNSSAINVMIAEYIMKYKELLDD